MKRMFVWMLAVLLVVVIIGLAAVKVGIVTAGERQPTPQELQAAKAAVCISNMRQLAMAVQVYAVDNGELLPPANRWVDCIWDTSRKHLVGRNKRRIPRDFIALISDCPVDKSKWSYAMNSNLSGRKLSGMDRAKTVLLFESDLGKKNAADNGKSWPKELRHLDGNCIAYADGHCVFLKTRSDFRLMPAPPTVSRPGIPR